MKHQFGKKIISLFLSVLMVVTMLPTFAVSVSAAATVRGNGVMSEYLTDSNKTGFSGTATWNDSLKAWYFDGSKYLKLDDTPLSGVTTSSGFAISFDVYNTNNALANKYFNFYNGSARITMDGSSPDWWTRYRTEISDGSNTRGYYTSDFTSSDFCSKTHTANGNDSYPTGAWHRMTVVMNTDGSYSYYKDGTLLATFKSNYVSTGNGGGLSDANAIAAVSGATNYIIGASDTGGTNGFTGYIRNFKIISGITNNSPGQLALLMDRYEGMMNGTVYTNMAAAYNAYVDANEAFDAYVYGGTTGQTNAQISAAYSALNTAMGNMTAWTAKTANNPAAADGSYSSSGLRTFTVNRNNSNYNGTFTHEMKNVLYTYGVSGSSPYNSNSSVGKCKVGFQYGAIVFLYNGSEMACPINAYVSRNGSGTRRCRSITPLTSNFSLKYVWISNESTGNTAYQTFTGVIGYVDGDTANASLNMGSGTYYYSNALYLNLASLSSYSQSYTPEFCFRDNDGNYGTNTTGGSVNQGDQTIYVVNYKALTDEINNDTRKGYLANVSSYKEGGLSQLVAAYDVATAINPNSYFSSVVVNNSSADNYVSKCVANAANAIKAAIEGSNGSGGFNNATITADTANSKDYIALRNAIDRNAAPTGLAGSAVNGISYSVRQLIADNGYVDTDNNGTLDKQLTGFSTFQTAYNNALTVMAALGGSGYNTNSTSNYSDTTAGAKATALVDAFNALNIVTLVAPTITIHNGSAGNNYVGKNNGVTFSANDAYTMQYSYRTKNGDAAWSAWSEFANYSGELTPFSSAKADTRNQLAEYKSRSTDGNGHYSVESAAVQVQLLSAPSYTTTGNGDVLLNNDTVSLASTSGLAGGLQYSYSGNDNDWHAYSTSVTPFTDNSTVSAVTVYMRQVSGTSISPVTEFAVYKFLQEPHFSVANNAYLGKYDTVSAVNNAANTESGEVTYEYHYGTSGDFVAYNGPLQPFSAKTEYDAADSRVIYLRAIRNEKPSNAVSITVHYLSRPEITFREGGRLYEDDDVTVSSTSGASDGLQYSIDGGENWTDISDGGTFKPFTLNKKKAAITVQVRQVKGGATSYVLSQELHRIPNAPVVTADGEYVDKTHGVSIASGEEADIDTPATLQYSTDGGNNWSTYTGKIIPFSGAADGDGAASYTVKFRATRTIGGVSSQSDIRTVTLRYLARPQMEYPANAKFNASDTVTVTNVSGATDGLKYSIDGGSNWADIADNGTFAPFTQNTSATKLTIQVKQVKDGSVSPVAELTAYKIPDAPNVTADGTYLDKTHGVTVANGEAGRDRGVTLQYSTDGGETWSTYSSKVLPFSGAADGDASYPVTVTVRATRTIDDVPCTSATNSVVVNYLARPTLTFSGNAIENNQEFTEDNRISVDSRVSNAGTRKYYISDDNGSTWKEFEYSASFAPFGMSGAGYNYTNDVTLQVKALEQCGTSVSAETPTYTILLKKLNPLTIYYKPDASAEKDFKYYNANGAFYVNTDGYEGCAIYYQTSLNGGAWSGFAPYSINSGIDSDDFSSYTAVKLRFFVIQNSSKTVFATGTLLNSTNYDEEVFLESFDDASISGTTLTFSDDSTGTLRAEGTASIVEGAGSADANGNSADWRNNVLKINANSTAPGNGVVFTSNPLATGSNAAAAQVRGVTISFWRYLEKSGTCTDLGASGDPTGYPWRNAIAFDDGNAGNGQGYYLIEVNGTNSVCTTQGTDYCDYVQENQDPTGHAAGNNSGHWVNVVVTIDPENGITLYTNGEPHEMKASYPKKGGAFVEPDAEVAQDILELITSSATHMYFNYGDKWEGNDFDLYLDDVRIYTGVKTQLEINNMYIGNDADVQSNLTSTSHDPTNVTVYTLAHSVTYTATGTAYDAASSKSVTLNAGDTVGQEVIDFCSLNPVPGAGDVTAVDEYSFGTGMTVYHRNKTTKKWEVVGDNAGRCGYQNQKLFGAEYHTALAEPLGYAAEDDRTGAGHLVWAPHVMFNLYNGTWSYYGSTSSWGSNHSAIFVCDAAAHGSIEGPYTYRQIVYKSDGHPNAIDPCVYYGRDGSGKPVTNQLYMAFGSWGGETCIALKTLYADGDGNTWNAAFDGTYLCNGINSSLEGASDGSSGEGAYIIYDNGHYYLYISYGQNTGSYLERVFRSDSPTGGFVGYNGIGATDTGTSGTHGGQILAPFDLSNYDYLMVSTGHNSVYKTVNDAGDVVTVNAAHARPCANEEHGWKALPDGALATRQSEVTGNITLVNQVAYTKQGWPVLMPFQYDGTDTVLFGASEITAASIEGVYGANDLQNTEYYNYSNEYVYTIVKDKTDKMLAYEYGTDGAGNIFKDYIVLDKQACGDKYYYYARYYAADDFDVTNKAPIAGRSPLYEGIIGRHGTNQIAISMICTTDYEYTWTYRISELPKSEDVDPLGDSVSMDGVIYTHATDAKALQVAGNPSDDATVQAVKDSSFALYGRVISDDFLYGTSDLHQGERCTTITTTYPAKIDLSNPTAIYCLSDEDRCAGGEYVGGEFTATALRNNKWFDAAGNQYTDMQAIARGGLGTGGASDPLKRLYGVTGYVSDYYFDEDAGAYQNTGVELIISYVDVENPSTKYSEFEFCYVMANPAMAHTIQGIRNQHKDGSGYKNIRAGIILFDRFIGSSGLASNIQTSYVWNKRTSASAEAHETGTYRYLSNFGSSASTSFDYSSPSKTAGSFGDFTAKEGVNSGSYGLIEHDNDDLQSYTVSSKVIDTDYYIDYSNEDYYDINNPYGTITTSAGRPTGYKFRFRTSNIKWDNTNDKRWNATSYMLLTGDLKTYVTTDSTYNSSIDSFVDQNCSGNEGRYTYGNYTADEMSALGYTNNCFKISGLGNQSTNVQGRSTKTYGDTVNRYTLGLNTDGDEGGRMVMSGYRTNPSAYIAGINGATSDNIRTQSDYYSTGLTRALPLIDTGNADTNAWNMHIDFTGTHSVNKNTDTSSAETYANFIIEQGIGIFSYGVNERYANTEETYAYYNIGVHTCDKGAARAFAKNYLRKKLAVTENADHSVTVKTDANGAPIYLDSEGNETTNVEEAALITPQDYTLKSYDDYIDAVAELNFFVKNPTNTTFKDYPKSGSSAATEYTTAYTAGGKPIYKTNTPGNNILGTGTTNTDAVQAQLIQNVITAYQNLFDVDDYTGAATDYANIELLDGSSAPVTPADVDTIVIHGTGESTTTYYKAGVTEDSWNAFVNLITGVSSAFGYRTDVPAKDETSWRRVNLSGAEYRDLACILDTADDTLVPAVNIGTLRSTYNAKYGSDSDGAATGTVTGGIFTATPKTVSGTAFAAGDQVYSYSSWKDMNDECAKAYCYLDSSDAKYALNQTGTIAGADVGNKDEGESDFTYTEGMYAVTGVTRHTFDNVTFYARSYDSETLSDVQNEVNSENGVLSGKALTLVDTPAAYENFDAANAVIHSLDMDRYTDLGQGIINDAASNAESAVYASPSELAAYNAAMGGTSYTQLKKTTTSATDTQTGSLLAAVNTVNNTMENGEYKYVKYFKITFTAVFDDDREVGDGAMELGEESYGINNNQTIKKCYGESFTLDVSSIFPQGEGAAIDLEDYSVTNWSISNYPGVYADSFDTAEGSQKLAGIYGMTLTKVANRNMAVCVELTENANVGANKRFNLLNCYGQLIDVKYGTNLTYNGASITDSNTYSSDYPLMLDAAELEFKEVPFYTITGWKVTKKSDREYTLQPLYSAVGTYRFTIYDGTEGGRTINGVAYDKRIDISVPAAYDESFAAWAVKKDGVYQIASYDKEYHFFAVTDETYVMLLKSGDNYVTNDDGTVITADKIDGLMTIPATFDTEEKKNQYVNDKIANGLPFVSIQAVRMESPGRKKVRAFVRVTAGADTEATTSYGVLFRQGDSTGTPEKMVLNYADNKTYKRAVTNKLESGQFSYTLTTSRESGFASVVTFRGFTDYIYTYEVSNTSGNVGEGNSTAQINALDYSDIVVSDYPAS